MASLQMLMDGQPIALRGPIKKAKSIRKGDKTDKKHYKSNLLKI